MRRKAARSAAQSGSTSALHKNTQRRLQHRTQMTTLRQAVQAALARCITYAVWAATAALMLPRSMAAQEPYPGLDAYIAKSLRDLKVPGAAVAIVRNDSVIYLKGFGVLAKDSQVPVNPQTLFEIGSSSKAFTATLVAMMVSDGKMNYDDLISKYLPDFKLYDPYASAQVTIRDALEHRSGIPRDEAIWIDAGDSREEVLHRVRFLKPQSPFRSMWSYQNIMYLAAGQAAGRAGGSTWDEILQQRIFTPLGMTSSSPTYHGVTSSNVATAHGMDHDTVYKEGRFEADNIAPAGGIMSNAHDMAQWLRFQLNDGVVGGKRLVSAAALRETHSPQIIMGAGAPNTGQTFFKTYGMGWMVEDYRHEVMLNHGGNTPGMTTAMGFMPDKKIGVVVLSNMDHTQLSDLLMYYIFDRDLGAPVRDYIGEALTRAQSRPRPPESKSTQVSGPAPLPLTAYTGTYTDSLYGDVTVSLDNGQLQFTRGLDHGRLEYWNTNNFRWFSNSSIPALMPYIRFDVLPDGKVNGVYYGLAPNILLLERKKPVQ
jgi:CubicO group peptidase (beta-lactamase class C family)